MGTSSSATAAPAPAPAPKPAPSSTTTTSTGGAGAGGGAGAAAAAGGSATTTAPPSQGFIATVVLPQADGSYAAKSSDAVRVVHISDTHRQHHKYKVPAGDILVHSGDFSQRMRAHEFDAEVGDFNAYLKTLPHKHKIFVAGNHVCCGFAV